MNIPLGQAVEVELQISRLQASIRDLARAEAMALLPGQKPSSRRVDPAIQGE
jgi:hypothetical protein